jgi:hypothetical protein
MTNNEYDVTESDQDVSGDIGVSSGRPGPDGAPTGVRDTSEAHPAADADVPPEQSPGGEETNPEGIEPKAPYPSLDPRSS